MCPWLKNVNEHVCSRSTAGPRLDAKMEIGLHYAMTDDTAAAAAATSWTRLTIVIIDDDDDDAVNAVKV